MDVSALRSRLVFLLGDDLKNLTLSDLKEGSFRTSRLVFSSLVFSGRTLQEEAERLALINDSRTRKLGLLRNKSDSRDDRKRVEEEYRHSFFEIILKSLLDLQFPPALEPFSDPLSSLKDDLDFRLVAMQFLLDNAVVGAGAMTDVSAMPILNEEDHTQHSKQHISHSSQPSPRGFTFDELCTEPPPRQTSSNSQQRQTQPRTTPQRHQKQQKQYFPPKNVTSSDSSSSFSGDQEHPPPPRSSDFMSDHPIPPSTRERCSQVESSSHNLINEYDVLRQSYEILQHHNEQLSKQLKILQNTVCQRNAMEVKMDLLMRDFSAMVSEIADIATPGVESTSLRPHNTSNPPPSTPPNHTSSRPLGAVLEENAAGRRKRPVSGSHVHVNESQHRESDSTAATVHWKQLQSRIQSVHTRWKSMRREAKRSVLATVSVHANASTQPGDGFSQHKAASFGGNSHLRTPGKESRQGSRGGISTAKSSFGDSRRGTASSRTSGRSFTANKHGHAAFEVPNHETKVDYSSGLAPAACATLHKILGVNVPISFHDNSSEAEFDVRTNALDDVGLDVSRVHQLQRDLVTFSRNAYTFSHLCDETGDKDDSTLEGQKKQLQNRLSKYQSLTQLRQSASSLLLHTACLCPLLPLECASPTLSSSKTGLDALVELVQPTLEAKKLWNPNIQACVDRAKSEQYSLLVSVTHSDMRVTQWQSLAAHMSPMIANFAEKITAVCGSSVDQVQEKSVALLSLAASVAQAEGVRMALSDSNSSLVSPVEALSRGYFGEEMADLVNRLRIDAKDISMLGSMLQNVHKQIMASVAFEMSTLVKCGDAMGELASI
mmetsp:Transcript_18429/g.34432  ORF Transcript_18429/g.34432 Transcript_18429/m.34432 type:complete len:830 (+) Transcript_18429:106-2595(+)